MPAQAYSAYEAELASHAWVDFADLVLKVVQLFKNNEGIRLSETSRYRFMMVDESQDSSIVQDHWIGLMAQDHENICIVGDTDQSIYEWRNARPEIMLGFRTKWENAKQITIDTNYRSTQEILDVANDVVAPLRLTDKLTKKLTSSKSGVKLSDLFASYASADEEMEAVVGKISEKIATGNTPSDIAILLRNRALIEQFAAKLEACEIKYALSGTQKFLDREDVKDALAWVHLAVNHTDYIAFNRIAMRPARPIGNHALNLNRNLMSTQRLTALEAVSAAAQDAATSVSRQALLDLKAVLESFREIESTSMSAGETLEKILEVSGYMDWHEDMRSNSDDIDRLLEVAVQYRYAVDFLEFVTLESGSDATWNNDAVVISTVHASK